MPILATNAPVSALTDPSYENDANIGVSGLANDANDRLGGFAARTCTSYVAYRMAKNGITYQGKTFTNNWDGGSADTRWSNATNWDEFARSIGYAVDSIPAIGAVAQWNAGDTMPWGAAGATFDSAGHVAYVANVSGGSVTIEDYNSNGGTHKYGTYTGTTAQLGAHYIHLERGLPGGWWQGSTPGPSSIPNGTTIQLSAHLVDNSKNNGSNGGLHTANLMTYAHFPLASSTWQVLKSQQYSGASTGDITANYTIPYGADYVRVKFDVYSNAAPGSSNSVFQLSAAGIRQYCMTSCPALTVDEYWGGTGDGGGPGSGGSSGMTNCAPGQFEVAVFTAKDYGEGGSCVIKGIGTYNNPSAIGLPNDDIESIKIGSGASAVLCDNDNINSPCEWFTQNDPDLSNNGTINLNQTSSMRVEGNQPTTGCSPGDTQVAFFMNKDHTGTCILKNLGTYNDPGAIGLDNDSISSLKVGAKAKAQVCRDDRLSNTCEHFDHDDNDLSNNSVGDNQISSAEVYYRGGITLYDNTGYGGESRTFGTGKYNMQEYGFYDRAESIKYDGDWANLYHVVIWTENNQTGNPGHYDTSVSEVPSVFRNRIRSIEVYKHSPPGAQLNSPADGTVFSNGTTSVTLNFDGGDQRQVHVWGNGIDVSPGWGTAKTYQLNDLTPGTYYWQAQAKGVAGAGNWSAVRSFTINAAPIVVGGSITLDVDTSQSIQVQAYDDQQSTLTLNASNLPGFVSFTDDGNGVGTLQFDPTSSDAGDYTITISASDGSVAGSADIDVIVNAPVPPEPPAPSGYLAEYFNNKTLSGTPVLTRDEAEIDNDWGGGGPGSGVNNDNFSARWTKTTGFDEGTYTFTVTADDGVRLYVDDQLIIDKWIDQGATTYAADKSLAAGDHTIKAEYYENGGGAVMSMSYAPTTAPEPSPDPDPDYDFVKGINFNGGAVTIEGEQWLSMSTALSQGLAIPSGYNNANTSVTPVPSVDSDTNAMFNTAIWKSNAPLTMTQTVENGNYQVYFWIMENYQAYNRKINVQLEGSQVATEIGYMIKGGWTEYGPYDVTVSDGTLNADLINAMDSPHVMGMTLFGQSEPATPPPDPGIVSGATYKIVNYDGGKALDVDGAGTADGTNVQIWADTGNVAQQWLITQNADSTYKLTNPNSGRVLDVNGAGTTDGTNVQIWVDADHPAQKWQIAANGDGTYTFINPNSGKVLDVNGGIWADGTNVQIWTNNGSAAQKWRLVEVEPPTPPPATPTFNGNGSVTPAAATQGETVTLNASFTNTSPAQATVRIYLQVRNPSDQEVYSRDFYDQTFAPGETKNYSTTWTVPQSAALGSYLVKGGAANSDLTAWYLWSNNLGSFSVSEPQAPATPSFDASGNIDTTSLVAGQTVTMNSTYTSTSSADSTVRIVMEIRDPSDQLIYQKKYDNETFTPGQTKNYTTTWTVPQGAATGLYKVKGGAVSDSWGTWYTWLDSIGQFTVDDPPAQPAGTELLSSAWNLVGNNGASEKYQSIPSNALAGKTTLRVTYNLHGLNALGGDASAIIFDQNGWKYVSLSNYGQNGLNGEQTVDIPLSAFGLDLNAGVGTLHTRFWYGSAFTVDITSIQVL